MECPLTTSMAAKQVTNTQLVDVLELKAKPQLSSVSRGSILEPPPFQLQIHYGLPPPSAIRYQSQQHLVGTS